MTALLKKKKKKKKKTAELQQEVKGGVLWKKPRKQRGGS